MGDRLQRLVHVQVMRRRDDDRINVRAPEEVLFRRDKLDPVALGETRGAFAAGDGHGLDVRQTLQRLNVGTPHEPGADNAKTESLHEVITK